MRVVLILAAVALTTGVAAAQAQSVTLASGLGDDTTLTDLLSGASAYYGGDTSGGDHENLQVSVGLRVAN